MNPISSAWLLWLHGGIGRSCRLGLTCSCRNHDGWNGNDGGGVEMRGEEGGMMGEGGGKMDGWLRVEVEGGETRVEGEWRSFVVFERFWRCWKSF